MSAEQPAIPDRLNGWKEIATFLGKGVRTVQRWEKEYNLPIHRLGRTGGEIIWASRQELHDWLPTQGPAARAADTDSAASEPTDELVAASPEPVHDVAVRQVETAVSRRTLLRLGYAGLALLAATVISFTLVRTPRQPATWEVTPGQLTVFGRGGKPAFSKSFPFLLPSAYPVDIESRAGGKVAFVELDGDSSREILFGAVGSAFVPEMGVFAYAADGTERFAIQPSHSVRFGSGTYAGPWRPHRMFVTGAGSATSIFVAFIGSLEYPSLLLELDARGRIRSEYWSNGYIQTVTKATWRGQPALFVGATNNETHDASLAIFADGRAIGSAPAGNPKYRCLDCAPGGPTEFLLFPRRALAKASADGAGQATVQDIRLEQDGKFRVSVAEGDPKEGLLASDVWYTLDESFADIQAMLTQGMYKQHDKWLAEGRVKHAFGSADLAAIFPVQRWQGTAFVELPKGRVVGDRDNVLTSGMR